MELSKSGILSFGGYEILGLSYPPSDDKQDSIANAVLRMLYCECCIANAVLRMLYCECCIADAVLRILYSLPLHTNPRR